jgi:hypothetical protein
MQIKVENIHKFKDATNDEINKAFNKIEGIARKASNHLTQKVLIVVWFGGHGGMFDGSTTTQIVTNDADETKRRFDFEQKLANISSLNNTYVVAFIDCCRNQVGSNYL